MPRLATAGVAIVESRLWVEAVLLLSLEFLGLGLRFKVNFLGDTFAFPEFTVELILAEPVKRLVL